MTTVSASVAKLCTNCDKNHKPYFCCKCLRAGHTYHKCSVGSKTPSTCTICGSSTHSNYNCPCRYSRVYQPRDVKKSTSGDTTTLTNVPNIGDLSEFPSL